MTRTLAVLSVAILLASLPPPPADCTDAEQQAASSQAGTCIAADERGHIVAMWPPDDNGECHAEDAPR